MRQRKQDISVKYEQEVDFLKVYLTKIIKEYQFPFSDMVIKPCSFKFGQSTGLTTSQDYSVGWSDTYGQITLLPVATPDYKRLYYGDIAASLIVNSWSLGSRRVAISPMIETQGAVSLGLNLIEKNIVAADSDVKYNEKKEVLFNKITRIISDVGATCNFSWTIDFIGWEILLM